MKNSKVLLFTMVCIVLGLVFSWQYQSIRNNSKSLSVDSQKKNTLIEQILTERNVYKSLLETEAELEDSLSKIEKEQGSRDKNYKALNEKAFEIKTLAGLTEVKGKGLTISIYPDDSRSVTDDHILSYLNDLRVTGAQAISVNEERIIATSEVRKGGNFILVNGKQITPPYIINAIGDPDKMKKYVDESYATKNLKTKNIKFEIKTAKELTIPKYSESIDKLTAGLEVNDK